jgi:ATP-binding cassette subfamily C protein LapB
MTPPASDPGAESGRGAADACLWPLLSALDWVGEKRQLSDALPEERFIPDFETLTLVLKRLKYNVIRIPRPPRKLDEDMLPALVKRPNGDVWVLLSFAAPGKVLAFMGRQDELRTMPAVVPQGELFILREAEPAQLEEQGRFGWLGTVLDKERRLVRLLFAVTFIVNCLALSLPLYLLNVFNLAINSRSASTLATLALGITIMVTAEIALREVRARAIARFAIGLQFHVMNGVFEKLLRLPISFIESASVAGQLNRLRTFEAIRDIFAGPLATSLLDLPFIFVFVIAIFALGGSLGWLMIAFISLLAIVALAFIPAARTSTHRAGAARSELRIFRTDLTRHLNTIRDCGAEAIWIRRYRDLVAQQLTATLANQHVNFAEQTLAQALAAAIGALVVGVGAVEVLNGNLSVGGLAAVMAIVWRVLAPIQTALLNLNRVFQAVDTARQINQLMKLNQESWPTVRRTYQSIQGAITLENVGYRAGAQGLPILRGIDMRIGAGQMVVLAGAPGPSRSVLLKLMANLYQPSVGRIRIDSCDVRQFDPRELHRCIAYVADDQIIFSGTLSRNLRFADPLADDERLLRALAEADLAEFVEQLDTGLDTEITALRHTGQSTAVLQKLRLARAYLQSASIYLFDEPLKDLDLSGQKAFIRKIESLKGHATLVIRTSDPRLMNLADGVAYLQGGQLLSGRGKSGGPPSGRTERDDDAMAPPGVA